ncbi:MAG TPA: hypothetical protein VFQ07_13885 [Candidatus Polarisedimenticolia bacterium]|nr:hypothetical protein [Candidatus Polarisedimenticolia bacterium]
MQTLLETILGLVLLLLVFRVSLTRRRHAIRLRGGLVTLNILCGLLAAAAIAFAVRDRVRALPGGLPQEALAAALLHLLPVTAAVFGGLAGFVLLGALWRRLLQDGPASARTWLRRAEFVVAIAAGIALLLRLFR